MFIDTMFSYSFNSMPLYFSEKLMGIQTGIPQFSLRNQRENSCLTKREGQKGSDGSMDQRTGANKDLDLAS